MSPRQVFFLLAVLLAMMILAVSGPVLPDEDDCSAMGKPADCWVEFDEPIVRGPRERR